jgi:hypothetical protein
VALAVALTVIFAIVGTVAGEHHGEHHFGLGGGALVWLLWIALAWRLFAHRRGRAR